MKPEEQKQEENKRYFLLRALDTLDDYFYQLARKERDDKLAHAYSEELKEKLKKEQENFLEQDELARKKEKATKEKPELVLSFAAPERPSIDNIIAEFTAAAIKIITAMANAANAQIQLALQNKVINQVQANANTQFINTHVAQLNPAHILGVVNNVFKEPVKNRKPELCDDFISGTHKDMHSHIFDAVAALKNPAHYLRAPQPGQPHPAQEHLVTLALLRDFGMKMSAAESTANQLHMPSLASSITIATKAYAPNFATILHTLMEKKATYDQHIYCKSMETAGFFSVPAVSLYIQTQAIQQKAPTPFDNLKKLTPGSGNASG